MCSRIKFQLSISDTFVSTLASLLGMAEMGAAPFVWSLHPTLHSKLLLKPNCLSLLSQESCSNLLINLVTLSGFAPTGWCPLCVGGPPEVDAALMGGVSPELSGRIASLPCCPHCFGRSPGHNWLSGMQVHTARSGPAPPAPPSYCKNLILSWPELGHLWILFPGMTAYFRPVCLAVGDASPNLCPLSHWPCTWPGPFLSQQRTYSMHSAVQHIWGRLNVVSTAQLKTILKWGDF